MRQFYGKKIGQSGAELMLAVFFSFFMHAAVVVAALFLVMAVAPKVHMPPFYEVKLVGQPAETAPAPGKEAPPPLSPPAALAREKPQPKTKKPAPKPAKAAPKKGAMPELAGQKPKQARPEQEKPEAAPTEQASAPPAPAAAPAAPGGKAEGVAVSSSSGDFKFPPYLAIIREKIEHNWNPPPSGKGMKAKVLFRVLRSGRVGDAKLQESSGNFYFDQASVRAILLSSPFPPMPEGFYKEYEVFSVDLLEKE